MKTIEKLNLNVDRLIDLRKKAIEPFLDESLNEDELQEWVKIYLLGKESNSGKYNEFYTTIKNLFS